MAKVKERKVIKCLDGKERVFNIGDNHVNYNTWKNEKAFGKTSSFKLLEGNYPKFITREMLGLSKDQKSVYDFMPDFVSTHSEVFTGHTKYFGWTADLKEEVVFEFYDNGRIYYKPLSAGAEEGMLIHS